MVLVVEVIVLKAATQVNKQVVLVDILVTLVQLVIINSVNKDKQVQVGLA